jgi:hypothetical protein
VLVVEDGDLEPALKAIDDRIGAYVQGSRLHGGRRAMLNGLKAILAEGDGFMQDEPVQLGLALVLTPSKQVIIMVGIARPGATHSRTDEVNRFMKSIRPL